MIRKHFGCAKLQVGGFVWEKNCPDSGQITLPIVILSQQSDREVGKIGLRLC